LFPSRWAPICGGSKGDNRVRPAHHIPKRGGSRDHNLKRRKEREKEKGEEGRGRERSRFLRQLRGRNGGKEQHWGTGALSFAR